MRDVRDVVIRPVVTERSTVLADEQDAFTFIVARDANKIEIRRAVEELFDVQVRSVRTMNYRGKVRRVGRNTGRRPGYKKAIVKLAEGERIDVYEGI
ncbi:MAG TPA: 50S ribosomal protein L23 [Longimicrobiales bacterium]|nr:50S ribosomal protein L23 [Longimicrobiales bacterium]